MGPASGPIEAYSMASPIYIVFCLLIYMYIYIGFGFVDCGFIGWIWYEEVGPASGLIGTYKWSHTYYVFYV